MEVAAVIGKMKVRETGELIPPMLGSYGSTSLMEILGQKELIEELEMVDLNSSLSERVEQITKLLGLTYKKELVYLLQHNKSYFRHEGYGNYLGIANIFSSSLYKTLQKKFLLAEMDELIQKFGEDADDNDSKEA